MKSEPENIKFIKDVAPRNHIKKIYKLNEVQQMFNLFFDVTVVSSVIVYADKSQITDPEYFCSQCHKVINTTSFGRERCLKLNCKNTVDDENCCPVLKIFLTRGLKNPNNNFIDDRLLWENGRIHSEEVDIDGLLRYSEKINSQRDIYLKVYDQLFINHANNESGTKAVNNVTSQNSGNTVRQHLKIGNLLKESSRLTDKSYETGYLNFGQNAVVFNWSDLKSRKVEYVSSNVKSVLGFTSDEVLAPDFDFHSIVYSHDRKNLLDELERIQNTKIDFFEHKPYRIHVKNSPELRWISEHTNIIRNKNNEIICFTSNIIDVTESKLTFEASEIEKQRLNEIIKGTDIGWWEWNVQTGETVFNDRWAEIIGYRLDEIYPTTIDTWMKYTHPDDLKKSMEMINLHFEGKIDFYECEMRMKHKNGEWQWILDRGKVLEWDANGKPVLMTGSHQDITNRKQAEEKLSQTRNNYQTFFNTIHDFLFVVDEVGNIIHVNTTVTDRLGFTYEEMLENTIISIHPADRQQETAETITDILNGKRDSCSIPLMTKSGELIAVETKVAHGIWDGKSAFFAVTKDISQLILSEQKFSKAFQLNPSACCLTDVQNQRYIEVNEAFYSLFGFSRTEIIGRTAVDMGIVNPEVNAEMLDKLYELGRIKNFEADLTTKTGEIKHVLISAENIDIQELKYRFTVVYDITSRKNAEDALSESQEQLKKYVGHLQYIREEEKALIATKLHDELGQILIALKMDIGMLKQKMLNDNSFAGTTDVFAKFDQLYALVGDSIKTTLNIMTDLKSDVLELLGFDEAANVYLKEFQHKYNIRYSFTNSFDVSELSPQDSIILFRTLQDLLSNVGHHSKASNVFVTLGSHKNMIVLEIADNGIGFDVKKKLTADSYGLIGMKERIYALSGKVSIYSKIGEGTVVKIEIPHNSQKNLKLD